MTSWSQTSPSPYRTIRYWHGLPSLETLRQRLAPAPLNTGRTIITPHGLVTDDIEAPYAFLDEQGHIRLAVGQEFSYWLYRGQIRDWPTCTPSLSRLSTQQQLLELARTVAFEEVIESHPLVAKFREIQFLNASLFVDPSGIAQHYGLCTDMLDLTCNFMVASFFATCEFNSQQGRYRPIKTTESPLVS